MLNVFTENLLSFIYIPDYQIHVIRSIHIVHHMSSIIFPRIFFLKDERKNLLVQNSNPIYCLFTCRYLSSVVKKWSIS